MPLTAAAPPVSSAPPDPLAHIRAAVDRAADLLPAQGPITVFVAQNLLAALEHLPFEAASREAVRLFGAQPYLSEDRYRADLTRGRIRFDGLRATLADDLGDRADDPVAGGLASRRQLRLAMLQFPVWSGPAEELAWHMAETDALARVRPEASAATRGRLVAEARRWAMRDLRGRANGRPVPRWAVGLLDRFGTARIEGWDDATWERFTLEALWNVCLDGVRLVPPAAEPAAGGARHRDWLVAAGGPDPDPLVHELLIRFTAAFLDQGLSHWPLPDRGRGFLACFCELYSRPGGPPDGWLRGLREQATRVQRAGLSPLGCVRDSLERLGVPPAAWDDYLSATLLALRGWGGMVRAVEVRGDRVPLPVPGETLAGFLAVRLLLDQLAVTAAARDGFGYAGPLAGLREFLRPHTRPAATAAPEQRAFPVFQLAQLLGWSPDELLRLGPDGWAELVGEVEAFDELERRRVFHRAYERRFRVQALDAVSLHAPRWAAPGRRPRFQLVACLDDREESFRRHLEEVAPDAETFGAAGFFGVAMYYRGAADAHFIPLCPIVIQPGHWVAEHVADRHLTDHERKARARKAIGEASRRFHVGTRSAGAGAVLTAGVGVLASVPLVARVLFPRLAARVSARLGRLVRVPPATRLKLERSHPDPGPENGHQGFTPDEMADIVERFLTELGLTRTFARLVFVLGHGSSSLNNPHKSAYDCGACGGGPGAPNGRAVAQMANDPRVRARLAARGITIPDDTWFVGGMHNTSDDSVPLADLDLVPESHRAELAKVEADFEAAADRDAHERCRRFQSARLDLSPADARRHVQGRSEDLAQTRPEFGHASTAVCVVGRRARTRGLFLDRRAFLASYDPTTDDADGTVLGRVLAAAVPVCGGISLAYYYSHVDPTGLGAGSKLPHNITALVGVMDGMAGDLRTGLPWQAVEIHEPVRLLFVVETRPDVILKIMARIPVVNRMVGNGWVQMAVIDPDSGAVQVFRDGAFHPYAPQANHLPTAATSADWYRGWRDHLEFAEVGE